MSRALLYVALAACAFAASFALAKFFDHDSAASSASPKSGDTPGSDRANSVLPGPAPSGAASGESPQTGDRPGNVRATSVPPGPAPKEMAWIPGGEFTMGTDSDLGWADEKPAHRVEVDG